MADALIRVVLQGDEAVAGAGRLSGALSRLERSEPTLALRSTRRAIDELAVAATGLHPVLGRVVATFTELGIGGAVGLASVAGLAALGLEFKYLINYASALDEKLLKLNTTFAQGTAAAKLFAATAAGRRAEDLNKPSFFSFETFQGSRGDLATASREGRLAEQATALNQEFVNLRQFHDEHTARLRAEANALEGSSIALAKAKLEVQDYSTAQEDALDRLAHRQDMVRLSTEHLNDADRKLILARDDEARAILRNLPLVALREQGAQIQSDIANGIAATPFFNQTLQGIKTPTLEQLQAQEGARLATVQTAAIEKQSGEFAFGLGPDFFSNVRQGVDDALNTTPGWHKGGVKAGEAMAAAFVTAAGQFQRGGAAGILGGFGSLASGASLLKDAPSFLGPLGFGLSAAGTLFSMFDHSAERRQREMMDELRRIRQNTEHRGLPDKTSFTFLLNGKEISGAVLQDVIYGYNRAVRTNNLPALPPS